MFLSLTATKRVTSSISVHSICCSSTLTAHFSLNWITSFATLLRSVACLPWIQAHKLNTAASSSLLFHNVRQSCKTKWKHHERVGGVESTYANLMLARLRKGCSSFFCHYSWHKHFCCTASFVEVRNRLENSTTSVTACPRHGAAYHPGHTHYSLIHLWFAARFNFSHFRIHSPEPQWSRALRGSNPCSVSLWLFAVSLLLSADSLSAHTAHQQEENLDRISFWLTRLTTAPGLPLDWSYRGLKENL